MPELTFSDACFTYIQQPCYICNSVTIPDDQEVVLIGKKYVCLCLLCKLAIEKRRVIIC